MSTKPGVTDRPSASISSAPLPVTAPTASILPSLIATSPMKGVPPLPSMIVPPRITMSCMLATVFPPAIPASVILVRAHGKSDADPAVSHENNRPHAFVDHFEAISR